MYIPQSKISEPKYTSGGQYVDEQSKKQYVGFYFKTADGRVFSGNGPNDNNVRKLIEAEESKNESISKNELILDTPKYYYPTPTEAEYSIGFMIRYFLKKYNENFTKIIEVSASDYKKFVNDSQPIQASTFASVKLNWKLTGPLYDDFRDKNFPKAGIIPTNQKLTKMKDKVIPGFSLYIKDYAQFAKPS
jgi:hypothetical protein